MPECERCAAIVAAAAELPDAYLLELHREISRLASRAYMRDPIFRARYELGCKASAARSRHGAHIATSEDRGQ